MVEHKIGKLYKANRWVIEGFSSYDQLTNWPGEQLDAHSQAEAYLCNSDRMLHRDYMLHASKVHDWSEGQTSCESFKRRYS